MRVRRGFLIYDSAHDQYEIDYRQTLSILVNELLLESLLAARSYVKGRLLDVGCGKRPYALIYDRLVDTSIGTEVAFSPHGTHAADLICFAESLPFPDQQFDTILCTEVLEHTRQPFQVMHELARLLKPNGHLILSVPFIYPIHEAPYDHWRFTSHGLAVLCRDAGLELVQMTPKGGVAVTMLALVHNITVRAMNVVSKLLRFDPPLYHRPAVRWLICQPQWWYLKLSRRFRTLLSQLDPHYGVGKQLSRLLRRNNALDEINQWLACGYLIVARKPMNG